MRACRRGGLAEAGEGAFRRSRVLRCPFAIGLWAGFLRGSAAGRGDARQQDRSRRGGWHGTVSPGVSRKNPVLWRNRHKRGPRAARNKIARSEVRARDPGWRGAVS